MDFRDIGFLSNGIDPFENLVKQELYKGKYRHSARDTSFIFVSNSTRQFAFRNSITTIFHHQFHAIIPKTLRIEIVLYRSAKIFHNWYWYPYRVFISIFEFIFVRLFPFSQSRIVSPIRWKMTNDELWIQERGNGRINLFMNFKMMYIHDYYSDERE